MRALGLAALAALPLQWFVLLPSSPIGELRLHQTMLFIFTGVVFLTYGLTRILRAISLLQGFLIANVYMIVIWSAVNVYDGISPIQPAQQVLYVMVFAAVAAYFFHACTAPETRIVQAMRWAGLVTGLVVIAAFGLSMLVNGINPISVLQRTIATGDPTILQAELFRGSFVGFGIDAAEARGNMRHEVFGALLVSMYIASWAHTRCPIAEPGKRLLYRAAMLVNTLMLLVSISRSVLLAAALWPVILFLRALLTGRVSLAQQVAAAFAVLGLLAASVSGFLEVLWIKFTVDTSSYGKRTAFVGLAFQRIAENFWTGGVDTTDTSSHNFVLDAWQRGGVFVAIPGIIVFAFLFLLWFTLLLRVPVIDPVLVPVVAALALPCVRLVTQGGGQIQLVSWTGLGFVLGVLTAHALQDRAEAPPRPGIAAPRPGIGTRQLPEPHRVGRGKVSWEQATQDKVSLWQVDPLRAREPVGAG